MDLMYFILGCFVFVVVIMSASGNITDKLSEIVGLLEKEEKRENKNIIKNLESIEKSPYIIIKKEDASKYLTESEYKGLLQLQLDISEGRIKDGRTPEPFSERFRVVCKDKRRKE